MTLPNRATLLAGLWLVFGIPVPLAGCGFSSSRDAASETMGRYFTAIETQDYPAAMACYAEVFFEKTPRNSWERKLRDYNRQLGNLERFEAMSWNVKKHVGANGGTFVQVVYKTSYSRHPAVEMFVLQKGEEGFRIIAHRVEVKGAPKQGETEFI